MSGENAVSQGMRVELPPAPSTLDLPAARKDDLSPSDELLPPSQVEQSKLASPAPLESSLTPPPSTQQQPHPVRMVARTPTPQASQLSSPPPTKLNDVAHSEHEDKPIEIPAAEWIAGASVDELRSRMTELAATLRQARAEAASSKMQYKMLSMESSEQQQRMAVELAMVQREVDVLQMAEARRQTPAASAYADPNAANATLLHEMSRHCDVLQRENADYLDLNAQLQRTLEYREDQLGRVNEENERLRLRIKRNREHTNSYLDYLHEHSPQSLMGTPLHPTPRSRAPNRNGPLLSARSTGLQPFEALLEADKVLSQETITAPSTPARGRKSMGHRTAHSLSSLPSTPQRSRAMTNQSNLQTPPHYAPVEPMTEPSHSLHASTAHFSASHRRARAGSSDSTITASSVERDHAGGQVSDDEIPESQASQAATSMLRRTPVTQSNKSSQGASFGSTGGGLKQTKLFGQITKPGLGKPSEKRRLSDIGDEPMMKRARLQEGVGLGIH